MSEVPRIIETERALQPEEVTELYFRLFVEDGGGGAASGAYFFIQEVPNPEADESNTASASIDQLVSREALP